MLIVLAQFYPKGGIGQLALLLPIFYMNKTTPNAAKHNRVLDICMRLMQNKAIVKSEEALRYDVNERTIQRDIDDLRTFFEEKAAAGEECRTLIYDHRQKCYHLVNQQDMALTGGEALAVCKILLESRAFCKSELEPILNKIIAGANPLREKQIKKLIANECYNYVPLKHNKCLVNAIWEIGQAVKEQRLLEIDYQNMNGSIVKGRILKPVGIMFSEFYFYLTAFKVKDEEGNKSYPTIYRIDRINRFIIKKQHFEVPYKSRFSRRRI